MRSEQKVNEVLVRDVLQTNHGEVKLTQGKKTETNVNTLTCTLHSRPKWGKFIIHFHRKPQKNDSKLFSGKSLRVCRKNSQEHIETVASNIRMSNKRILPWTLAGRISHWTGLCSQGSIPTESDAISISLRVLSQEFKDIGPLYTANISSASSPKFAPISPLSSSSQQADAFHILSCSSNPTQVDLWPFPPAISRWSGTGSLHSLLQLR